MKIEPASFPVLFFFSAFPFVRLFTSAKTSYPIFFFVNKEQIFCEREFLYPQSTTRENTGRVNEILYPARVYSLVKTELFFFQTWPENIQKH